MHPYLHLPFYDLPVYGLFTALGLLAAGLYVFFTNRSGVCGHIGGDDLFNMAALAFAGAFLGAKLLYVLSALPFVAQHWTLFSGRPGLLFSFLAGGLVFYGGLLGGLGAVYWYCRRYAVPFGAVAAVVVPGVPLFHVFGRVGCFFAGCCWGVECLRGIAYTIAPAAPNGVPLFPVQLVEAGANLILFLALAALVRRLAMEKKWMVLPVYLCAYAVLRFVLEFVRGDAIRGVFILSTSQWISLGVLLAVGVWAARAAKKRKGTF